MTAIFHLLYREYCRSRLAEMRKQLLIQPKSGRLPEANDHDREASGRHPVPMNVAGDREEDQGLE
jgi:hypothetical protein